MASICKRKDGTWCGAFIHGIKPDGKPKRKYVYGKTKKEVEEKIRKFSTDVFEHGGSLDETKITLEEWLSKHLFVNVKSNVASSTFDHYVERYEKHVKGSFLGVMDIKNIKQIHLQEYFNQKTDLAYESLKKIYNLLNGAFEAAISNNLIRINPIKKVKIPSITKRPKEIKAFTREEQKAYMEQANQDQYGLLFITTLFTGMRLGEITALRWGNIDLEKGQIYVIESVKRVKVYDAQGGYEKKYVSKPPKSKSGERIIPIPQFLSKELKKYKLSSKWTTPEDIVFSTSTKNYIGHENIRRTHNRLCDRANIKRIPFHGLRHTFATRLVEQGENFKTVQDLLGHADIQTTMNIYVHVMEETKKAAVAAQEKLYQDFIKVL